MPGGPVGAGVRSAGRDGGAGEGQIPEIGVLSNVVDQGLGQQRCECFDQLFWKWADRFRFLGVAIVAPGVVLALRWRGGTCGREERIHVVLSCHRRKASRRCPWKLLKNGLSRRMTSHA
jgi:hypothetical protein